MEVSKALVRRSSVVGSVEDSKFSLTSQLFCFVPTENSRSSLVIESQYCEGHDVRVVVQVETDRARRKRGVGRDGVGKDIPCTPS